MSTTTHRESAPRPGESVDHRLARLLDTPRLAQIVPHLTAETLQQIIQRRGLDACVDLVTAATPAQLTSLLDLDLWRHAQPGRDEQFDVERFGDWLDALVDAGDSVAARTVAVLDPHLVTVGLSRYLRVFDPGTFEPTASTDDEAVERHDLMNSETSRDVLECEVGGYLVRARRPDAWDAIVALLVTLEIEHHDYFHAVMQGCRPLSNSRPEVDGLDDLLMAPEQYLQDVAIERERRRSRQGYASPADARAFLQLARQRRVASAPHPPAARNPIAAAYFRAAEEDADPTEISEPVLEEAPAGRDRGDDAVASSVGAVIELLVETGVLPDPPRALLEATHEDPRAASVPFLRRLTTFLQQHDESAYLTRSRELAFLANTLLAGCSVQSRPFTPREASEAAAGICNLGLECWPAPPLPDTFLVDHDLVSVFEVGWSVLHRDVSLFAAERLAAAVAGLRGVDADTGIELRRMQRQLVTQGAAGTPWLARDAVDVLAGLDLTVWIGVLGLLDECPILPAALTAVLEHRTTPVSPTAFQFISTAAQLDEVRAFLRALPGVLSS